MLMPFKSKLMSPDLKVAERSSVQAFGAQQSSPLFNYFFVMAGLQDSQDEKLMLESEVLHAVISGNYSEYQKETITPCEYIPLVLAEAIHEEDVFKPSETPLRDAIYETFVFKKRPSMPNVWLCRSVIRIVDAVIKTPDQLEPIAIAEIKKTIGQIVFDYFGEADKDDREFKAAATVLLDRLKLETIFDVYSEIGTKPRAGQILAHV